MSIDVNLGREKGLKKILLYESDEPKVIARRFAEKYGLNEAKVKKLEVMIA